MDRETCLWSWLLFGGAFAPHRAKSLLTGWDAQGIAVADALQMLPQQAARLGLTAQEVDVLQRIPAALPAVDAIRWNEPEYPAGLHELPERQRPALLFTQGDRSLLLRPLIMLYPGALSASDQEMLREAVELLLGEPYLLAALAGTPQAEILEAELSASEGEGMIVAREGLARRELTGLEQELATGGRLLFMTPLAGQTAGAPHLDAILTRIAVAAAGRLICCDTALPSMDDWPAAKPVLWLTAQPARPGLPRAFCTDAPADVLEWVAPAIYENAGDRAVSESPSEVIELGPPPSPEQVLETLAKGGAIPEALRRRLAERARGSG